MIGTWEGPVDQPGSVDYSIRVVISGANGAARTVAEVFYPGLECGGTWRLVSATENAARVIETITSDPEVTCIKSVPVELSLVGDQMSYTVFQGDDFRSVVATATLNRRTN